MSKNMLRSLCCVIIAGLIFTSLAACSKVNQANFDKVQTDMSEDEVTKILGSPTESSGVNIAGFSGNTSVWQKGDITISIQFLNGKVVAKTMTKGKPA
ncbi:MAG: hypothetical protein C4532_10255 [Candidatus Abyssobacteria bacterium SURF_17]|uniref:Uncharacterized protein n=1 Tax=Candidatus Abyssobacteria bacterium SURF_17 TaxID=2093361 RepID=A0A419EY21_9BACT|nr:MAG: hypothetical protein C4532_10255 [Candidatus Abyssubacteria bacterium SURF_17]